MPNPFPCLPPACPAACGHFDRLHKHEMPSHMAQLDASDRASRERIESAAALLEKQAEMLRRKSMEQLDEQIRQYEAKVAKGERGDTPSKLASLKREMSVVQSSGKAVSSGFCRFLQCLP